MVQRIFNVDKWTALEEGQSLAFLNDRPRNVRLEVNAPREVEVSYICTATGQVHFLALVKGRDVLEFGTVGPFEITASGPLNIFTNDGDDVSVAPTATEAYVEIMERRRRNPELEHIAYMMQLNTDRRLEQQAAELEAMFARRLEAFQAAQVVGSGDAGNAGAESASTGTTGSSGTVVTQDGGPTNDETENQPG